MRVQLGYLVCHSSSKGKVGRNVRLQGWGAHEDHLDEGLSLAVVIEKTHRAWSIEDGKADEVGYQPLALSS